MSAFKRNIIYINVTGGDCVENNRKSGKSNTGTYFVCSEKKFSEYKYFFNEANIYKFALWNIEPYRLLFNAFFKSLSEEYKGKMANFDEICSKLLERYKIDIDEQRLRILIYKMRLSFKRTTNSQLIVSENWHGYRLHGDIMIGRPHIN